MNIFRTAFELFALYLLYKLVFDLIIPVAKTTNQVKKQFGDMQNQMKENMQQYHQEQPRSFTNTTVNQTASKKPSADDYIEFEEVK
jgi:Sec-independent protein translocase protein TatA